ncbi:MAG: hypothetical protein ACPGTO_04065 [Polaribacter sp.]
MMKKIISSVILMLLITIAQGQTIIDSNPLDSIKLPNKKIETAPISIADPDPLDAVKLPDDTMRMGPSQITYSNPWHIVPSPYGNIYLGAFGNLAYFYTDRSRFLFNRDVYATNAFSSSNNDLILKTKGTERLRINDDNGNVGIGTTNPLEKLHINGSIRGNASGGALRVKTQHGSLDLGARNSGWAHIYTDRPRVIFNKDVYTITNAFSSYNNDLILKTKGTERLRINDNNGFVGVGTSNPTANLHVKGNSNPHIILSDNTKKLELGLSSCYSCYNSFSKPGDGVIRMLGGGDLIFSIPGTNLNRKIAFHSSGDKILTIQEVGSSGKVGVGTVNFPTSIGGANISAYKLFVKGGLLTEEVRVRTGWADYVFADDYNLKPLSEVEAFIKENKHLPNVPSANTVETQGIELGNISKIQQEKIEELTLYIIRQEKRIKALETKINKL